MMQEFDLKIKYRRAVENVAEDHFSLLDTHACTSILDSFLDENILEIIPNSLPWYAHKLNYLVIGILLED